MELLDLYAQLISHIQGKNMQLAVQAETRQACTVHQKQNQLRRLRREQTFRSTVGIQRQTSFSRLCNLWDARTAPLKASSYPKNMLSSNRTLQKSTATAESTSHRGQPESGSQAIKGTPAQIPSLAQTRTTGKTMEAIASLSSTDPFGPKTTKPADQKKNEPLSQQRSSEGVSLAAVEQAEEAKRWQAKQAELRARPLLKKLEALGADIELLPLRPSDTGV